MEFEEHHEIPSSRGSICEKVKDMFMRSKTVIRILAIFSLIIGIVKTNAQGSFLFQNLNFEQANVPFLLPGQFGGSVAVSNALPGWTAYMDSAQQTDVLHNNQNLDLASISILSANYDGRPPGFGSGNYFVFLKGGGFPGGNVVIPSIGQTGQIPTLTQSLRLTAYFPPIVTFGGNSIPLLAISSNGNNTVYAGDVSTFAGQIGELKFTGGFSYIDNIFFSNQAIPEPSTLGLIGLGVLLLCRRLSKK